MDMTPIEGVHVTGIDECTRPVETNLNVTRCPLFASLEMQPHLNLNLRIHQIWLHLVPGEAAC